MAQYKYDIVLLAVDKAAPITIFFNTTVTKSIKIILTNNFCDA